MNSLVNILNQEMPKTTEWFACSQLNVNVDKSTAMPLHPRQIIINTDDNMIKINNNSTNDNSNNTTLPFSISTKYLGMYIDNDFL